jgi:hypothetical protein
MVCMIDECLFPCMIPCILFSLFLFLYLFSCYLCLYSVDSVYVVLLTSFVSSILHFYACMERLNKLKLKSISN